MSSHETPQSFVWRVCLWVCVTVGLIFQILFSFTTKQEISRLHDEIDYVARKELEHLSLFIQERCSNIEIAAKNLAYSMGRDVRGQRLNLDNLFDRMEEVVSMNPELLGLSIGFEPEYSRNARGFGFCPFVYADPQSGKISRVQVGEIRDFRQMDFYAGTKALRATRWSKPYIGTRGQLISNYCIPMISNDRFVGVFAADMDLRELTELVNNIRPYKSAIVSIIDGDLEYVVHPEEKYVTSETLLDRVAKGEIPLDENAIKEIRGHESGEIIYRKGMDRIHLYYAPIPDVGWTALMECSEKDTFAGINKVRKERALLSLMSMLLLLGVCVLLLRRLTRPVLQFSEAAESIAGGNFHTRLPEIKAKDELYVLRNSMDTMQKSMEKYMNELKDTSEAKGRIEGELQIARGIQMSMVPKIFPPFPDRREIDLCAMMTPAKEVGGDLYDFYIRDDKLFFCIGDVSGKGVPASLVMAVTRSLFRTLTTHEDNPAKIMGTVNDLMSESNDSSMFVTFFLGVMNLVDGHLFYCNAGHNAPLLISQGNECRLLDVVPNIPLGIMTGYRFVMQEQDLSIGESLFLYTDGLTEAENPEQELFGEKRMMEVASGFGTTTAMQRLDVMEKAVNDHIAGAVRSDDLTMLTIIYQGISSRHHLSLRNEIGEIGKLESLLKEVAEEVKLDPSVAMNLNLALEEAVTNIIRYAYPPGKKGFIGLDADVNDGEICFTLIDGGLPFDPTTQPDPDLSLDVSERPIGGLGIYMVRRIMDDVQYAREDMKNILTMIKKI